MYAEGIEKVGGLAPAVRRHLAIPGAWPMVTLIATGLLIACGGNQPGGPGSASEDSRSGRPTTASSPVEPGPWIIVDRDVARRLEGQPVYHQGPQEPPVAVRRRPVELPVSPDDTPEAPLLVKVLLGDGGRVAKVRVLRSPSIPLLEPGVLEQRLVETLRDFRFEPARLDGEPVPVYYSLSLQLASGS